MIFYNNDYCDKVKEARECLLEEGFKHPTEVQIQNEIEILTENEWDYTKEILNDWFSNVEYGILFGVVGRWNGRQEIFFVFKDLWDAISKAMKDCDTIKIWTDKKHLRIEGIHHDGRNIFEIKEISAKGEKYIYNNDLVGLVDRKSGANIVKNYSVLPKIVY